MTARRLRLRFSTRLGLIITAVIIAAGASLLAVQYFVVQQLFASAIAVTAISCGGPAVSITVSEATLTGCGFQPTELMSGPIDVTRTIDATGAAVLQQSAFLSDEVGGGLIVWSIVTLLVFAVIAAAIAFWLARRSLARIGEVTAAARDISERDLGRRLDLPGPDDEIKELGDTFDRMLDRLQLAFAAQDRFVANASHELRTPLTTTRTALEIPLAQGAVPAELEEPIRRALRATDQSERLIAALLLMAKGRWDDAEFEPVPLAEVVAAELEELAPLADDRAIAVTTSLDASIVLADPTLLARAVRNLLDNGIRHNRAGGELHVRVLDSTLEVESTGGALDPADVALLTEPFHRGDASRLRGDGIGLGLAIVESIAVTHGGTIALAPREGGGLIATLALPRPAAAGRG